MVLNLNMSALYAMNCTKKQNKSIERLSTGYRINRAGDDAAGLTISEKMRSQIRGLNQAAQNVQDGISLVQTAEGGLNEIHSILQRVRELSVQSANDTNTKEDRESLDQEVQHLLKEVDHIVDKTEFNSMELLNGDFSSGIREKHISLREENFFYIPGWSSTEYVLDFNSLGDGAVIEIEGVKFEFDSDGIQNDPDAAIVDISSRDFDDIAVNFETTFFDELNGTGFEMSIFRRSGSLYSLTIDNDGTTKPESDKPDITATSGPGVPGVGIMIQAGCNSGNCIEVNIDQMSVTALGLDGLNVLTRSDAEDAITLADDAINTVSEQRSNLGAVQNRLEHTYDNLGSMEENTMSAESRIRDADMAGEKVELIKNNILLHTAQAMMVQANQEQEGIIKLLE